MVHSAGIQDRDGGISLLASMKGLFPFLEKLFADSAYQGPLFAKALGKILPRLETEIVKRSDHGLDSRAAPTCPDHSWPMRRRLRGRKSSRRS